MNGVSIFDISRYTTRKIIKRIYIYKIEVNMNVRRDFRIDPLYGVMDVTEETGSWN